MRSLFSHQVQRKSYLQEGSRAIAAEENCPPTPKLTLTQTLTLTRGQFYLGAIVWLSPTLKLTLTLTQTPTLTGGQFYSGGNCPDTLQEICSEKMLIERRCLISC